MTHEPVAQVSFEKVVSEYGARDFYNALAMFLAHHENPNASRQVLRSIAAQLTLNFDCICVFHKIKLWIQDPQGCADTGDMCDVVHARSMTTTWTGRQLSARFDTALIDISSGSGEDDYCGVEGKSEFWFQWSFYSMVKNRLSHWPSPSYFQTPPLNLQPF
jgi:hypothetical protein